jgi:hypothetical protein
VATFLLPSLDSSAATSSALFTAILRCAGRADARRPFDGRTLTLRSPLLPYE